MASRGIENEVDRLAIKSLHRPSQVRSLLPKCWYPLHWGNWTTAKMDLMREEHSRGQGSAFLLEQRVWTATKLASSNTLFTREELQRH